MIAVLMGESGILMTFCVEAWKVDWKKDLMVMRRKPVILEVLQSRVRLHEKS
jgi:hypothetical protein